MRYTFERFCEDCREAVICNPGLAGRETIVGLLEKLLRDEAFVGEYLGPELPPGRHTLLDDTRTGLCILAYNYPKAGGGTPHDHGPSWAVYGQAKEYTDIRLYERVDGGSGDGPAEVSVTGTFRLDPGKAALFDVGVIHSIHFPPDGRVVRVTGVDLDKVPKLRFDMKNRSASVWWGGPSHGNSEWHKEERKGQAGQAGS